MTNKIYTVAVEVANEPTAVVSLNATRTAAQGPLKIIAKSGALYQLTEAATGFAPQQIQVRRKGKDLHISLEQNSPDRPDLIIENYFGVDNAVVVGQAENGQHYPFIPDTARDIHAIDKLADGTTITQVLGGQVGPVPAAVAAAEPVGAVEASGAAVGVLGFNPLLLGGAAAAAAAGAGGGGGGTGGGGNGGSDPAVTIDVFDNNGQVNNSEKTAVPVSGKTSNTPGGTVEVIVTDKDGKEVARKTVPVAADGTWNTTVDVSNAPDGALTAKAVASTTAGTKSPEASKAAVKDTFIDPQPVNPSDPTDPNAPTGNNDWTAKLDPDSNTGDKTDNITTVNKPVFSGKGEPGGKVEITLPSKTDPTQTVIATAIVDANGNWKLPAYPDNAAPLPNGVQQVPVKMIDPAGNSANGTVAVDIRAPLVTITTFDDNAAINKLDNLQQIPLSGTAQNATTVDIVIVDKDGVTVFTRTAVPVTNGQWSITADLSAAPEGKLTAKAVALLASDNLRSDEVTKDALKDTFIDPDPVNPSNPTGPNDWTAGLDPDSNTGDKTDTTTGINTPLFSGKGEPGGKVEITLPSKADPTQTVVATAIVDANGNWKLPAYPDTAAPLPNGTQNVPVKAIDPAGNSSEATLQVTIIAPEVGITTFDNNAAINKLDNLQQIPLSGTAQNATTVDIVIVDKDGATVFTRTSVPVTNGQWSITADLSSAPEGKLTAKAVAVLAEANLRSSEVTKDAVKDTFIDPDPIKPSDPTGPNDWTAGLDPDSDTGTKGDGATAVNKPLLSGKGEPGGTVEITLPSKDDPTKTVVVTATVQPDGTWKLPSYPTDAAPLPNGQQNIPIKVIDPAGNEATAQLPVNIQAPTVDITHFNGNDRPNDAFINKAEAANVTIRGSTANAPENSVVTVRISDGANTVTVSATVNAAGEWTVTPSLVSLNEGAITATAVVAVSSGLPSGNITSAADTHNQVKDTVVMPPTFTDNASDTNDISLAGKSVFILDNTELNNLTGYQIGITSNTSDPLSFSNLSFSRGGSLSASTISLSTTELNNLSQGLYTIEVRGTDQAGNTEVFQQVIGKSTGSLGTFVATSNNTATGNPNLDNYFINQKGMNEVFDLDGSGDNDKVYFLKTGVGSAGNADEATIRNFNVTKDQIVLADILSSKNDNFVRFENVDLNGNTSTLESTKVYISTTGSFGASDNTTTLQSKADQVIYIRDFNADLNNLSWLVI